MGNGHILSNRLLAWANTLAYYGARTYDTVIFYSKGPRANVSVFNLLILVIS
jgi:hypothetical protein